MKRSAENPLGLVLQTMSSLLLLASILMLGPRDASALFFSDVTVLQDEGFTQIDLFSHQGMTFRPTSTTPPFATSLSFFISITGAGTDTLFLSSTLLGFPPITQTHAIPPDRPLLMSATLIYPEGIYDPTLVTLTVDILNSDPNFVRPDTGELIKSFTYSFVYQEPVPEPSTVLLVGSGLVSLAAVVWSRHRRK